jgi:prepilin-type N-terminal cleavage/methylation domain-containing protein
MKTPSTRQSRAHQAFTLIELLIVISIIAILASVSVPVTKNVMNSARKTSAQNDCIQIQNALKGFYNEYFHYPVSGSSEGPYKSDAEVMDVLMNVDGSAEAENLNRRRVTFYEASKITTDAKLPGYNTDTGTLNDPWGQPYEIYMDADDDESLTPPAIYGDRYGKSGRIKKTIFVHSGGPDRKIETIKDNVSSWD